MPITPSGKLKIMQAQAFHDQNMVNDGRSDFINEAAIDTAETNEPVMGNNDVKNIERALDKPEPQTTNEKTLSKYISRFLEGLGYPGRRLQQFKDEFVVEKGGKGTGSQYTITLPDRVYGKDSQIPSDKLKSFIEGVEKEFGYSYQKYSRSGMKVIFDFSSLDESESDEESSEPGDILDEVFGTPKGKKSGTDKKAESIQEMQKSSMQKLAEQLKFLG